MRTIGLMRRWTGRLAVAVVLASLSLGVAGCAGQAGRAAAAGRPVVVFCEPITDAQLATSSARFVRKAETRPATRARGWSEMACFYTRPGVRHGPLWWEDPFEDKDKISGAGYTGLTWEDWFAMVYSDGRWMLNTMLAPVSMGVTPIWTPMCSDGKLSKQLLGYDHDAAPCKGVPVPYDLRSDAGKGCCSP